MADPVDFFGHLCFGTNQSGGGISKINVEKYPAQHNDYELMSRLKCSGVMTCKNQECTVIASAPVRARKPKAVEEGESVPIKRRKKGCICKAEYNEPFSCPATYAFYLVFLSGVLYGVVKTKNTFCKKTLYRQRLCYFEDPYSKKPFYE